MLGNDIARTRVLPDPVVTLTPTVENDTGLLEEYPECRYHRSMSLRDVDHSTPC